MADETIQKTNEGIENSSYEELKQQMTSELYDKPSPFHQGGYTDDEAVIAPDDPEAVYNDGLENGEQPMKTEASEEVQPPVQKRKFNYGNQDYEFTDDEIDQLARNGMEYNSVRNKLSQYSDIINNFESNPEFAKVINDAISAYNNRVPISQPKAEQEEPKQDFEHEPEIGENEDYDDYEKRLSKWRTDRDKALVDSRVNAALNDIRQRQAMEQARVANEKIINYVRADPNQEQVLSVIAQFPDDVKREINWNGERFMREYDEVRRRLGLDPYFGAPSMYEAATPQHKPKVTAPFTESGKSGTSAQQVRGGVNNNELPDFKKMSDKDFAAYKDRVMFNRF